MPPKRKFTDLSVTDDDFESIEDPTSTVTAATLETAVKQSIRDVRWNVRNARNEVGYALTNLEKMVTGIPSKLQAMKRREEVENAIALRRLIMAGNTIRSLEAQIKKQSTELDTLRSEKSELEKLAVLRAGYERKVQALEEREKGDQQLKAEAAKAVEYKEALDAVRKTLDAVGTGGK